MPLASVPLKKKGSLNSTLALKTSKSLIQLDGHKDFTRRNWAFVSVYKFVKFFGWPLHVWWWLFLAYEKWCFSRWHHFIVFWMGFPHTIILHDKFKMVHCYEVTDQNIPSFFCYVYYGLAKWATSWENLFMPYANIKGADQPAHPRSLISAFIVRWLDSVIPRLAISKFSRL